MSNSNLNNVLYKSGDVFLPKGMVQFLDHGFYFDNQQRFYINLWTGLHFLSGIIVGSVVSKYVAEPAYFFIICLIIHTLWESWQVYIGMSKPWLLSGSSNLIDSVVDTIAFMGGVALFFYKLKKKYL
jgi:hypothetical protein